MQRIVKTGLAVIVVSVIASHFLENSWNAHAATPSAGNDNARNPRFSPAGKAEFMGQACETARCVERRRGYDWAQTHQVSGIEQCKNSSAPFVEGCRYWIEEQDDDDDD